MRAIKIGVVPARASRPYVVAGAVLLAAMAVQTWGQRWSGDYWLHRAAVLKLSQDPWTPAHPLVATSAPDASLSPYTLGLGLVARVTGADIGDVLSVAALANLVLLLVGLHVFVRRFSDAPLAPFWTLLATLFAWGIGPWRWSGYLNANSIGFGLPYPSMFAFAVMLFGLSALHDVFDRPHPARFAAVALAAAVVALAHPFTGLLMLLAAIAVAGTRVRAAPGRVVGGLGGAVVAAGALVLAWPHYPMLDLLGATSAYDTVSGPLYRSVVLRTFLVAPALVALGARRRADRRDPLVVMFALAAAVFTAGWVTDRDSLGRVLPLAMLAAHVALGVWLAGPGVARWRQARPVVRSAVVVAVMLVLAVGIAGSQGGLSRVVPAALLPGAVAGDARLVPLDDELRFLEDATTRDDVLLAAGLRANRVAPGLGATVVAPGYPVPFLDDVDRRRADVAAFFTTTSPTERRRVIEAYGVTLVLFEGQAPVDVDVLGAVVYRDERFVLVSVDP